jgi:hypothetical protein
VRADPGVKATRTFLSYHGWPKTLSRSGRLSGAQCLSARTCVFNLLSWPKSNSDVFGRELGVVRSRAAGPSQ